MNASDILSFLSKPELNPDNITAVDNSRKFVVELQRLVKQQQLHLQRVEKTEKKKSVLQKEFSNCQNVLLKKLHLIQMLEAKLKQKYPDVIQVKNKYQSRTPKNIAKNSTKKHSTPTQRSSPAFKRKTTESTPSYINEAVQTMPTFTARIQEHSNDKQFLKVTDTHLGNPSFRDMNPWSLAEESRFTSIGRISPPFDETILKNDTNFSTTEFYLPSEGFQPNKLYSEAISQYGRVEEDYDTRGKEQCSLVDLLDQFVCNIGNFKAQNEDFLAQNVNVGMSVSDKRECIRFQEELLTKISDLIKTFNQTQEQIRVSVDAEKEYQKYLEESMALVTQLSLNSTDAESS